VDEDKNKKNQWFGPKRNGYGFSTLVAVIIIVGSVTLAHDMHPSWFKPKTIGSGFTPATWEGWLITLSPIVVILLVTIGIYLKQRKP
jgi:hypothetical protein